MQYFLPQTRTFLPLPRFQFFTARMSVRAPSLRSPGVHARQWEKDNVSDINRYLLNIQKVTKVSLTNTPIYYINFKSFLLVYLPLPLGNPG